MEHSQWTDIEASSPEVPMYYAVDTLSHPMDPELEQEIRALLERLLAVAPTVPELQLDLEIANATGGLPVYVDMGGAFAITAAGELLFYDHETGEVSSSVEPKWGRLALTSAAEKYPPLAKLAPARPPAALSCPSCRGTGRIVHDLRCGACVGTGWVDRETPTRAGH